MAPGASVPRVVGGGPAARNLLDLEQLIGGAEPIAEGLVRLEVYPDERIGSLIDGFRSRLVVVHPGLWDPVLERRRAAPPPGAASPELLLREHRIFGGSLDELSWIRALVERDGHGGNRQALGQYLRIFLEAVRRHLADESRYLPSGETPSEGERTA